jgi:hypothetical protein
VRAQQRTAVGEAPRRLHAEDADEGASSGSAAMVVSMRTLIAVVRFNEEGSCVPGRRTAAAYICTIGVSSLFVCLVADGWCWFVLREKYCWLVAGAGLF